MKLSQASSSESGTTDLNGQVTLNSRAVKNPAGEWCFEVTDVTLANATYNSSANLVTQACESGWVKSAPIINSGGFSISGVYPNPFRNATNIEFELPQALHVTLEIYSVLGERVALLADQAYDEGQHTINWNTQQLKSGMYLLRLKAGEMLITRRLILMP